MTEMDSPSKPGVQSPQLRLGPPPVSSARVASRGGLGGGLALLLVLLLLANLGVGMLALRGGGRADGEPAREGRTNARLASGPAAMGAGEESLAIELEERSLWAPAAAEWLAVAQKSSDPGSRAKAYYRAGSMYEKASAHEQAAAAYVAAEALLGGGKNDSLKSQIGLRLTQCFRMLGRSGELGRELARRVDRDDKQGAGQAKILAYVGEDPLTEADLDRLVEAQVDRMLGYRGGAVDPEAREQALRRFREPQQREAILKQLLEQEVLVRRAREQGLDREDAYRENLIQVERSLLSNALLQKEIGERLEATPGDLKNYYEAHKDRYKGPPAAKLLVMELKDKAAAEALAKELAGKDEKTFMEAAKTHSIHEATKAKGGEMGEAYTKGGTVLGLAHAAELDAFVFGKPIHEVSAPIEIDKRCFLFFTRERSLDPQKSFEEVKEEVRYAYLGEKQKELTEALVNDLQGRYKVRLEKSAPEIGQGTEEADPGARKEEPRKGDKKKDDKQDKGEKPDKPNPGN